MPSTYNMAHEAVHYPANCDYTRARLRKDRSNRRAPDSLFRYLYEAEAKRFLGASLSFATCSNSIGNLSS